jgi:hypothetical protein
LTAVKASGAPVPSVTAMNCTNLIAFVATLMALPHASTRQTDQPLVLELAPRAGGMRSVQARIGTADGTFLFDTGGGATVLSLTMARQLACPVFGRGTGFRHDGSRVDGARGGPLAVAFGSYVHQGEVGVLDLDAMLPGMPKVAGIACLETFAGQVLTVDLADNRLVLETPASLAVRTRSARELKVRLAHQAGGASLDLFVALDGKHGPLWFELDSGNTAPVLIAPHAWVELGLDAPPAGRSRPCDLPVTGLGKVACEAMTKELIYDGLLNVKFCERFAITMDLDRGRAWAAAN